MQKKSISKVVVVLLVSILMIISTAPAFNSAIIKVTNEEIEIINDLTENFIEGDWYWKSPYTNYAPSGMPDFDQKQNQWKSILDGGNRISETNATGDDIQLIPYGNAVDEGEIIIAPGENCQLDTNVTGDDIVEWTFCGPVALANCFWWFDSKFSNPEGIPGDGEDEFSLIEDYGSGDDHSSDNVPILIEKLARVMNTSYKGFTSIGDMENAIDQWLVDVNLSDSFEKNITDKPTFNFLEGEITRSQNVILLLGYYDYIISEKLVDQSQPVGLFTKLLQSSTWWDYQSFKPSVERLDAIRIRLRSSSSDTSEIEINVYDTQQGEPIGTATLDPGYLTSPTWIQFHFEPFIELTPADTYYFDVRQKEHGYHYEWDYESYNPYNQGTGWMDKNPYDPYGFQFDWTFETEFYDPPPGSVRREGHYVTCAGINSKNSSIAFSDPRYNISNPDGNNHNDAKNVSHDQYKVNTSCPLPDLDYNCWLPDYPTKYTYTIIEQAIIICPIPDEEPPIVEITKPRKAIYFLNEEIYPFFFPIIVGPIDIVVTAADNKEVEYVEFIINNKIQKTDYTEPYKWRWEEGVFFVQIIDIVAVDSSGNYGYTTLTVLKFF